MASILNTTKEPKTKPPKTPLNHFYDISNTFEIGVDEAGRGPLFGRLYVSAVILPKEGEFSAIKDSKKIKNKKTIKKVSDFIKANAIAYSIKYVEHDVIDRINIRESVLMAMHQCIDEILTIINDKTNTMNQTIILVDGNDFRPYMMYNQDTMDLDEIPSVCIEKGDGLYYSIAAASILAKVARDEYILELCNENPLLIENYHLDTNMGYGTREHIEGIKIHGITQWHRKTYGICSASSC